MLKLNDAPNLAPEPEVTYWLGDPAVDRAGSNVALWAETGSLDALVPKGGAAPSAIEYRALDELELMALPSVAEHAELGLRFFAAARYGLESIDGVELSRGTRKGLSLVSLGQAKQLQAQFRAEMPLWRTMNQWISVWLQDESLQAKKGNDEEDVGLMVWLGAQILIRSFPRG